MSPFQKENNDIIFTIGNGFIKLNCSTPLRLCYKISSQVVKAIVIAFSNVKDDIIHLSPILFFSSFSLFLMLFSNGSCNWGLHLN